MISLLDLSGFSYRKIERPCGASVAVNCTMEDSLAAGMLGAAVVYFLDNAEGLTVADLLFMADQCGFSLGLTEANTYEEVDTALRAAIAAP